MSTRLHAVLTAGLERKAVEREPEDVSVKFEEIPKVLAWAKKQGKMAMRGTKWSSFFLTKAVVERCKELYSKEGVDTVNAAIVYYMDLNDYLTAAAKDRSDPDVKRIKQALLAQQERAMRVADAEKYLARAAKQRKEDNEMLSCVVAGGGKCNVESGTSREQVRVNNGGPSYDELYPPATIQYYEGVVQPVRRDFPESLWDDAPSGAKKV